MEKLRPVHSEGILARIGESINNFVLTEHIKIKKSILCRCRSNCIVLSYRLLLPPSSSALTDTLAPRRLHLARIRLKQEGIPVPGTRQREDREEGAPLVVLLEPLVLGVLPASVLPTVVTLLVLLERHRM